MTQGRRIVFAQPRQAELEPFDLDESLQGGGFLVETVYSLVSPGTEVAWFSGVQKDVLGDKFKYPIYPGYCNVGRVVATGPGVPDYQEGDLVVSHASHASLARVDFLAQSSAQVPEGLPPITATFCTMAEIAMTATRLADLALGDQVLVIGLGLVGNLAAQLFQLAGADVLAADLSPFRVERAGQCGIEQRVNPGDASLEEAVMDWSQGQGAQITVESVGATELILQAMGLTRRLGEVILLGTPRKSALVDATPAFYRTHMLGITIKGALRGLHYPVHEGPFSWHSSRGDMEQVLEWLSAGRLKTEPLRTHLLLPEHCQEVYEGLERDKEHHLGVILDWTGPAGLR